MTKENIRRGDAKKLDYLANGARYGGTNLREPLRTEPCKSTVGGEDRPTGAATWRRQTDVLCDARALSR